MHKADLNLAQSGSPDKDERYRELIETAEQGIWILSPEDKITFVNAKMTEMLGCLPEELLGKNPHLFLSAKGDSSVDELLARNRSGEGGQNEIKLRHKNGAEVWTQVSSNPIRGTDGAYAGTLAIFNDITARKRAERALKESERRFHELFANAPVGIYRTTRDGSISMANPALLSMLGYSFEELVGRNLDQDACASTYLRGQFKAQLERDGHIEGVESAWKKRDESLVFVRESARIVRDENGKALYYEGMVEDITERKLAEQRLRRSEARLRSLIDNAPYGIYRSDPRSDRFAAANPALVRMLGYSSEDEVLALELSRDIYVNRTECTQLLQQYERESRFEAEAAWKRKDGSQIKVRLRGRKSRGLDSGVWLEGYVEDLSECWLLEEQLRQAQKMEAIGRLAGGIAHDFNNLLMVMSGYTELLQETVKEGEPQHKLAIGIAKAVARAKSLTKQLLVSTRQQVLSPTVIDLNAVLADSAEMLGRLIGENIEFVVSSAPALGRIKVDPGAMQQILMNLAVNARDAMPDGGKLSITTANVSLDDSSAPSHLMLKPGQYVMLVVSDTGSGMDKETQSRIFDPFFTTKEQGKGTGLGLSIVYGVVKDSGGAITVESERGRGSTFRIYLPRVDAAVSGETVATPKEKHGSSQCILLVEDEDAARDTIRMYLESRGYTVLQASTPTQALDYLERHQDKIHLLLTDMVMPGMTGRDLANQALQIKPELKVLYMSGYSDQSVIASLGTSTAFLQKPFSLKVLTQTVWELLEVPIHEVP
ncbi:MAG: PAS domain S-box protein [Terriglobales bacterium]